MVRRARKLLALVTTALVVVAGFALPAHACPETGSRLAAAAVASDAPTTCAMHCGTSPTPCTIQQARTPDVRGMPGLRIAPAERRVHVVFRAALLPPFPTAIRSVVLRI